MFVILLRHTVYASYNNYHLTFESRVLENCQM
jgi:hypothetical protein